MGGETLHVEATWTPPPPVISGRVDITCERGKLSIAIFRPEGRGKPADISTVDEAVAGWPLDARDENIVAGSVRSPDGKPRVFATMSPSGDVPDDSPVAVKIGADDFAAWLIPWAPDANVEVDAVKKLLADAGVKVGVDEALLAQLAGRPLARPVQIASGRKPVDGVDAKPEFVIEQLATAHGPTVGEGGRVDFRDIGGLPTVQAGDVLIRKIEAIPAQNGFTVRGTTLPAKEPKDLDLKRLAGQNTVLDESGKVLTAKISGLASRVGERVAVMPLYSISGDVDFNTGNIDFEGNLAVSGGVKTGFKVKVSGAITVGGTIEAAQVEAGGDITVNGGIVGQGEGVVRAGGSITARFVEAAELHAGGPITVGGEIRQSNVISEHSVTVGGAGRIVGGLVRGKDHVEAKLLGSPSGTPTSVQAGWGEELRVDADAKPRAPRIAVGQEVNVGVVITVAGATQRITHASPGGVWREAEGKIQYSAS
jgi:hypothetical protein